MATATATMFILYPIVVTLTSFFFFKVDGDQVQVFDWMLVLTLTAIAGGFWGFTFGTFIKNEVTATQLNTLSIIFFSFGAGVYANTGEGMSLPVEMITYISPLRYATEMLFRIIGAEKEAADQVRESLGYTWGNTVCLSALFGFIFVCFVAGWLSLLWKTREI